tara:strand:- start:2575 stop:3069 length:495 start_codon:yes stop_codon:yes gene_type:complete
MNIIYIIIVLLTIFTFVIHKRKKTKEHFDTNISDKLANLKEELEQIKTHYYDIFPEVMLNYKFECPKQEVVTTQSVDTDDSDWNNISKSLNKFNEYNNNVRRVSSIKEETIPIKKPNRLEYDLLSQDIIDSMKLEDITEIIDEIPTSIPEQTKLNNYIKCYNKN